MKSFLTFFVLFFVCMGLWAQTFVPDENFREAINDELGQPIGYDPTVADLNSLTGLLDVGDEGILSIQGAEYLTGIDRLYIDDNQITDISPIAGLINLERLFADGNQIVDISAVTNLTSLSQLKLDENQIVDVTAVSGLTNLYYLDLGENQIVDISPLASLVNTSWIYLDNNQISSISALEDLVELDRLYLYNNEITEIYNLVQNTGLESGDLIYLERYGLGNPLSVEAINVHVPELEARGVDVHYPDSPNLEAACYPAPEREDNTVPSNTYFRWQGNFPTDDASYNVYAGTEPSNLMLIGIGELESGTEYFLDLPLNIPPNQDVYWQIETVTLTGSLWSEIWHFSTPDANAVFADFTADQTSITNVVPISFTDTSFGIITSWSWDFDNDGVEDSDVQNPSYTYSASGTYTVTLTVSNGVNTDTETKIDYITVDYLTPEFTDLGLLQSNDQTSWTPVNNTSMYDYSMLLDPNETYYYLDMTAASATNTPLQVGLHPFYFDVVPDGFFDYWAAKGVFENCPNTQGWELTMYEIIISNLPVFYISYASDGSWQLVDGLFYELTGTSDDFKINGDYHCGDYIITGNVTGANGIVSNDISVNMEFYTYKADFEADYTSIIPGTTVQFTDLSNGTPDSWSWDFNEDGIEDSDLQNPTYTFNSVDSYDVTLVVEWGAYDDTETKVDYIVVSNIVVPDDNFREALNDILGEPSGYYPTIADLNGITGTVDVSDEEIISIEGAQNLTGIDRLYIDDNQIVDLSPIAGLVNLERLFADGNQIVDISAVAGLTALDQLKLDGNQIVDISAVAGLTALYYLDLGENLIVDISPLSTLTATSWIYLDNNEINEISALSGLLELDRLYIYGNEITDIYPLTLNTGFGDDDVLYLERYGYGNPLSHESMNVFIPILEARGFSTIQYPAAANLEAACYPVPSRDATGISLSADLQWQGNFPTDVAAYKVWFGEDVNSLAYVGDGNLVSGNTYGFTPTLALNGEYWWRIECVGTTTTIWSGLWHFEADAIELPEFTDLALTQSTDPGVVPWTAVPNTSMYDYSMLLDPAVTYYYLELDPAVTATNMELTVGVHPFYLTAVPTGFFTYWANKGVDGTVYTAPGELWKNFMWEIINGNEAIFYVDYLGGGAYMLVDGLVYQMSGGTVVENFKVNGDYHLGDYVITGNISTATLVSDDISINMNFHGIVADFEADATIVANGTEIQFTDLSTGNPTSWAWDFDNDGNVDSTDQNPAYTYPGGGTYTVSLTVSNGTDTDTETKVDYITVAGTHFVKCWSGNGYQQMQIIINSAQFDGIPLDDGDEIGVFDGSLCVGAGIVSNSRFLLEIITSADDPDTPELDGFTSGDYINFKIWGGNTEICVNLSNFVQHDGKFEPFGLATVDLQAGTSCTSVSQYLDQGWNLNSLHTDTYNYDMINWLQSLINDGVLVKAQDETGGMVYNLGNGWINTIGDVALTEGYYINVTEASVLRNLIKYPVLTTIDIPLTEGWNIIGCPFGVMDPLIALQQLINDGFLVKVIADNGNTIEEVAASWVNAIGQFYCGSGYFVKVNDDCVLSMNNTGDANVVHQKTKKMNEPSNRETYHFQPAWQNNPFLPMNFYVVSLQITGITLEATDELAVFDGDICVGTAQVGENNIISLIAATDDIITEGVVDGFTTGNYFDFKFWDSSTGEEYDNFQINIINGEEDFLSLGSTELIIEFLPTEGGANLVPVTTEMFQNYPNPFNPETTISFGINDAAHVTLEVYNIKGEKVTTLIDGNLEADYYNVVWDGTDANNKRVSTGVYFYKMKADKFVQSKKMILMK